MAYAREVLTTPSCPCPACGHARMKLISAPRPEYVEQCSACDSTFFSFGAGAAVSHLNQYNDQGNVERFLENQNNADLALRHEETITRLSAMLSDVEHPRVFDVGAGGGSFLVAAQRRGYRIAGNEVSSPAVEACEERYGIKLTLGDDLAAIAAHSSGHDAVTMWCVIAHVDDPEELLRGVRALLKPHGVLFFSTPRYCAIDRAALLLRRITRDRYRRAFDRRINRAHRRQYSKRGIEALLRREGFTPTSVESAIGYGFHMKAYLTSIGIPQFIATPVGTLLEQLAKRGLLPRNILNVYARLA